MTFDAHRDPLPIAHDAIDRKGTLPCEDVVFLAQALVAAHAKVDQLYSAIEARSDATRTAIEQVLRETANFGALDANGRMFRRKVREALDRGVVFTETPDQQRLDWLAAFEDRLLDARGRVINESVSLREAIDWLMQQGDPSKCA